MVLCLKINRSVDFAEGLRFPIKQNIGRWLDVSL